MQKDFDTNEMIKKMVQNNSKGELVSKNNMNLSEIMKPTYGVDYI